MKTGPQEAIRTKSLHEKQSETLFERWQDANDRFNVANNGKRSKV